VVGVPAFPANQGDVAGTRVMSTRITTPDRATQKALRIGANDFVIEIQRVRLADGSPISRELAQFPADAFPGYSNNSSADRSTKSWKPTMVS
jgi:GntR family transcriptional regulator